MSTDNKSRRLLVEIEKHPDGSFYATIVDYPECRARSLTRTGAINLAMELLRNRVQVREAS